MWTCDKCGKPVKDNNDAVTLEYIRQHGRVPTAFEKLCYGARHLLPTKDCLGSPSRAQYLEGMPRDTRGYPYEPELEIQFREAYRTLKKLR